MLGKLLGSRRTSTRLVALFITACLALAATAMTTATGATAQSGGSGPASAPTAAQLQNDQRRRAELGFNSDPSYIASLWQSYVAGQLPGATLGEGALLTAAESAEIVVRNRVQAALPDLARYAQSLAPDRFAGSYMDQQGGGVGVVAYTDDPGPRVAALRSAFPFPDRLRVTRAQHSLNELSRLQLQIQNDIPALRAAGVPVGMAGVNEEKSIVDVRLYGPVPPAAEQRLLAAYPSGEIAVSSTEKMVRRSSDYTDAPPLAGGQWVINTTQHISGLLIGECTSNFIGYKTTVVGGVTFSLPRVLTAGHCGAANNAFTQGLAPAYPIGHMERAVQGGIADAGSIVDSGSTDWAPWFLVDLGGGNSYHLVVHQMQAVNTIQLNTSVCQYGTYGGYHCGTVNFIGSVTYVDPYTGQQYNMTQQVCDTALSQEGDSGGPVFQNLGGFPTGPYQADGVLDAGDNTGTCWTQEGNALAALQLNGLFTN